MTKLYRFLLLGMIGALILSACGGGGKEATSTSAPELAPTQPAATATSAPEPSPTPETAAMPDQPTETPTGADTSGQGTGNTENGTLGDLLSLGSINTDLDELGGIPLQSYRLRIEWVSEAKEGSSALSSQMTIHVAHTSDPLAEQIEFYNEEVGDTTKMVRIGDQLWFQAGDRWIQVSSDDMAFEDAMFAFESATPGLTGDAQLVGEEDLNGVATRHYAFDETILGVGAGVFTAVQGEVWVAVEGDYVVRYVFTAEDDEATYSWDWELYDVNAPFTIEPPTEAQGARDDIPLMADATERSSVGALTTYQTASDLAAVTDFYREQMPVQGWTYDEASSMIIDQFTLLAFSKGDAAASITITPGDDGAGTTVVIQVSEGE